MGANGVQERMSWKRGTALVAVLIVTLAACTGAKREAADGGFTGNDDTQPGVEDPSGGVPTIPGSPDATAVPTTGGGNGPGGGSGGGGGTGGGSGGGSGGGASAFRSTLFSADRDLIGITKDEIRLCIHAALTYGAAFNTGEADLDVYWRALNEEKGGVFGRKVRVVYVNDNYNPDTARAEVTRCNDDHKPFLVLGGIGFDQIPSVRNWAEENKMLYIHHTATIKGAENKKYSYSGLPTTEKMGEMFAELAISKFKNKRIAIIKRASDNWEPGVVAFKALAKKYSLNIVYERPVQINQGNYSSEIQDLRSSNVNAQVVWVWLNALETTQFVKQARAQQYAPTFMVFPFNLESQTLDSDALNPRMVGVGMYQAYSHEDDSGEFRKYKTDIVEFKRQMAKYRPNADLSGVGGDLIFLAWSGFKAVHRMLELCETDCSRNRMVETLYNLKDTPAPSYCKVDFSRSGRPKHGGYRVSIMETYTAPDDKVNWRNTNTCVEHLI